jgi:hypothetical protein
MDISWNEDAVAAMRPRDCDKASGDLEVVAQGSLTRVLDTIAATFASDIGRMRISFPDRRKPPFRYEGIEIAALLAERARATAQLSSSATINRRSRQPRLPRG